MSGKGTGDSFTTARSVKEPGTQFYLHANGEGIGDPVLPPYDQL